MCIMKSIKKTFPRSESQPQSFKIHKKQFLSQKKSPKSRVISEHGGLVSPDQNDRWQVPGDLVEPSHVQRGRFDVFEQRQGHEDQARVT